MMRRSFVFLGLVVATSISPAFGQGPDIAHDFVLTDNEAIGMLSPRVVCASQTMQLMWSPDGQVLLARRMDVQKGEEMMMAVLRGTASVDPRQMAGPTQELVFYSPKSNKVRAVVPLGDPANQLFDISWVPGSQQVLVQYDRVYRMAPSAPATISVNLALVSYDGRVTSLLQVDESSRNFQASVSPSRPLIAVMSEIGPPNSVDLPQNRVRQMKLAIYNASAKVVCDMQFAADGYALPEWGKDGALYIGIHKYDPTKRKMVNEFRPVELSTGKLGDPAPFPGAFEAKPPALPLQVVSIEANLQKKEIPDRLGAVAIAPANAKDLKEYAVVSTDAREGFLSPAGDAVAYISRGVAMMRPLAHIPKEAFLLAKAAAKRTALLSQGKQVALAMIMCAADLDDMMPVNGTDLHNLLDPYMKNDSLLDGFVYSFKGGALTDVESPAETEMGYIPGDGGRAIIYIDGHVKWKSDKP